MIALTGPAEKPLDTGVSAAGVYHGAALVRHANQIAHFYSA